MKVYIEYDGHPDLNGVQRCYKHGTEGLLAEVCPLSEVVGKVIKSVSEFGGQLVLDLEDVLKPASGTTSGSIRRSGLR